MNKKIIRIWVISLLLIIFSTTLILRIIFSSQTYMGGIQDVTFFSYSPSHRDKGFNELTYNGVRDYANAEKTMVGDASAVAFSDDGSSYVHEISNIYDLGANTIVSSGVNVGQAFSGTDEFDGLYEKGYGDKTIVLIDNDTLCEENENAISISFEAKDAGFLAGIMASIYTNYSWEVNGSKPSVALWGGFDYQTIYGMLSSFEQAINWFNYQILGFDLSGNKLDKSLKVNEFKDLKDNHNKSLELQSTKINGHSMLDEPIKINNAGDTIVNYDLPPKKGSNDTSVSVDPKLSFYTGGFSSDPNDGNSGSRALVKIKKINSTRGNDAILFPVAGGQTTEALENLSSTSSTAAIGVDSDAEMASPNYADHILGSATKNIERASNFGTWYSQNRNASIEEQKAYKDSKGMSAFDFINDWSSKGENIIGTKFIGGFDNGGVGFEDNHKNKIGKILNYYGMKKMTTESFLEEVVPDIYHMNNNVIETSSETFAIIKDGIHNTDGMYEEYPWIPNWKIYKN